MGNSDLRQIAVLEQVPTDTLHGTTVAVDGYQWMWSYMTGLMHWCPEPQYTTDDGLEQYPNILGALQGLPLFFRRGISPVFVFDGTAHTLKADEQDARRADRERRKEMAEEARERGDYEQARQLQAQAQNLTPEMVKATYGLFDALGVPYLEAPGAGEAQAAAMAARGDVDAALSDDYDTLLFGSPETIRDFSGDDSEPVERMDLEATLDEHGITHEELVDAMVLAGTDYNDGVHMVGVKRGLKTAKEARDIHHALELREADIPNVQELRDIFLDPDVTTDYRVPRRVSLRPDRAEQYLRDDLNLTSEETMKMLNRVRDVA